MATWRYEISLLVLKNISRVSAAKMQNLGEEGGANKVHYGRCASGE